jgi:hypothetical protein
VTIRARKTRTDSYEERAQPAEASYYRRFVLLRKFVRWVCRRDGVPDPFLDLDDPVIFGRYSSEREGKKNTETRRTGRRNESDPARAYRSREDLKCFCRPLLVAGFLSRCWSPE